MKNSTVLMQAILASLLLAGCNQAPAPSSTDMAQAPMPAGNTTAPAPPQEMAPAEPANTDTQAPAPASTPRPVAHVPSAQPEPVSYPTNPPPVAQAPLPPPSTRYPPPPRGYPGGPPNTGMDANFYRQALAGGEKEVRMSQLSLSHSTNGQVRQLAQMFIRDHSAMNSQLSAISGIGRVPVADNAAITELSILSGPQFDRLYLADMLSDHRDTIALFQDASRNARSDVTRKLATNALPKLRGHLGAAQRAQQAIGQKYPGR